MSLKASNQIVNALWIGDNLSDLELLTINSFLNNGHSFYLWTYNEIRTTLPKDVVIRDANEIIPSDKIFRYKKANQFGHGKGSLGGFSDIFRYKLLYEHGGWWTDMDVCCLKKLDFEEEYVFRTHHSLSLVGNLMKCPAKSELMQKCYTEAVSKVDENNTDWHLPIQILCDNVKLLKLEKYIIEITNPDSWNFVRLLLKQNVDIPSNWHAIHWVNEELKRNNIAKDRFLFKSFIYNQFEKNNMHPRLIKGINKFVYRIKLTKLYFAVNLLSKRVFL